MPLYEYECPHCGHKEDVFCPVDERHKQSCGKCGKPTALKPSMVGKAVWVTDCPTASKGR